MTTENKPVISINPPPRDRCCEVCHKNINDLKAFGGPGDPLVGDFTGAKLVKNFRPMAPHGQTRWKIKGMMVHGRKLTKSENKEYKALEEKMTIYENEAKTISRRDSSLLTEEERGRYNILEKKHYNSFPHLDEGKFILKYGKEELEQFYFHDQLENTVEASWECRDCICLDSDEKYFKKKYGDADENKENHSD